MVRPLGNPVAGSKRTLARVAAIAIIAIWVSSAVALGWFALSHWSVFE